MSQDIGDFESGRQPLRTTWPNHLVPSHPALVGSVPESLQAARRSLVPCTTGLGQLFVLCEPTHSRPWGLTCELIGTTIVLREARGPLFSIQEADIQESEATVERSVVVLLENTWKSMLYDVRYAQDGAIGAFDGVGFTFGYHRSGLGFLIGEAHSPPENTRPGHLVLLSEMLRDYVCAPDPGKISPIEQAASRCAV
jgi:hypothetical protein